MEQKNAGPDKDGFRHVHLNRHGQVHSFELNEDYSCNPYSGIGRMHFARTCNHLVMMYRKKNTSARSCPWAPDLIPRLMDLQAGRTFSTIRFIAMRTSSPTSLSP